MWNIIRNVLLLVGLLFISEALFWLKPHIPDYTSRGLYIIGYEVYQNKGPLIAVKAIWMLANRIYPVNGHIWVELASLEYYGFRNENISKKYLEQCIQSPAQYMGYPASQCREVLSDYEHLTRPGMLSALIMHGPE